MAKPEGMEMGKRLTTRQVSERTGVPEETLRWWRAEGRGPRSFNIGRKVFYLDDDCDEWERQQYENTVRGGAA